MPKLIDSHLIFYIICFLAIGSIIGTRLHETRHRDSLVVSFAIPPQATLADRASHAAVALLALVLVGQLMCGLWGIAQEHSSLLAWTALAACATAVGFRLAHAACRSSVGAAYLLGLAAIGLSWIQRDFPSPRFLVWAGLCEITGFLLFAAFLGWAVPRLPDGSGTTPTRHRSSPTGRGWFLPTQAIAVVIAAGLITWVSIDFSFQGVGSEEAILGISGRFAACPAALMLLGTSILMAWQCHGEWRIGWQYAAMASGVLFTSSFGWASLDPASSSPWVARSQNLLFTSAMMTLMTGYGLGRLLPRRSDWGQRGREAMPAFAFVAAIMSIVVVVHKVMP
jgi:hypothetical protein